MSGSSQQALTRVRPPRVKITYDVETGGAIEKKELPFIVGILADLAGTRDLPKLKERKFTEIDRDNFDTVLRNLAPSLKIGVPNRLEDGGKDLSLTMEFAAMADFDPVNVVRNLTDASGGHPLCKLYDARNSLRDLLAKLDGNDDLDDILNAIAGNAEEQASLRSDLEAQKKLLAPASGTAAAPADAGTKPEAAKPAPS